MKQLVTAVLVFILASAAHAGGWPHTRGPQHDGRTVTSGAFGDEIALEALWQVPVGSAYSGIAVEEGKAVTMFGDGEADWVGAFDVKKGKELWRFRLGDPNQGIDGADDGPLSSPTLGAGKVFALGADGRLVALKLGDGSLVWSTGVADAFGAKRPHFGFTSTPLFVDGMVILQTGGADGKSIVAFDAGDGRRRWSHGDGEVQYQSPSLMTLAGERTVVAVSSTGVSGLAPATGKPLWEVAFAEGERANSANPAFAGDDRFSVSVAGKTRVYVVKRGGEGLAVEALYDSEALGRNYVPPIFHDGHLYGFRGQVLTCVNADSGERVWRSREPGGDGLILVDDHLVIFGGGGNVVVARASAEGYDERARVQALLGSSLTWPSFADGRIFVRNLESLAAVSVKTGEAPPKKSDAGGDHGFGRWLRETESATDRQARVDAYFKERPGGPIVEGEWVHFVYRGAAEDVAIAGSMSDTEAPQAMERLAGTDLFHRSYRLEPGGRWEYAFQVDYETWTHDAGNPRTVPAVEGDEIFSELVTDGYEVRDHLKTPEGARGKIEEISLNSKILEYEKRLRVWTPPGYGDAGKPLPLIVVNDGDAWLERARLDTALDNLTGKTVEPAVVVFVDAHRAWWTEAGGSSTEAYARMLAEELLPMIKTRYRISDDVGDRSVVGNRFFAVTAVYTVLAHPEAFGKAGVQSVYLGLGIGPAVEQLITTADTDAAAFYLDWNRYDERNIDRGFDFAEDSRRLDGMLRDRGFRVAGGEVLDSRGWGGWRNRADGLLSFLEPIEE